MLTPYISVVFIKIEKITLYITINYTEFFTGSTSLATNELLLFKGSIHSSTLNLEFFIYNCKVIILKCIIKCRNIFSAFSTVNFPTVK